uniref:Uncharacterized protein n=1 Tax=Rhizophora mucronata TaxID=61149 RepID=A0A2P2M5K6_RHIMU
MIVLLMKSEAAWTRVRIKVGLHMGKKWCGLVMAVWIMYSSILLFTRILPVKLIINCSLNVAS